MSSDTQSDEDSVDELVCMYVCMICLCHRGNSFSSLEEKWAFISGWFV